MPNPRPDILTGPLRRGLIRFAMPLAFTQLLAQLFTAADLAVVGRFVGKEAMAAVGSCTPLVGIMVTLFFGTSIGSNVVIATWIGAGDPERARRAETTSLWIAVVGGCFLTLVGELLAPRVLRAMSVPDMFPASRTSACALRIASFTIGQWKSASSCALCTGVPPVMASLPICILPCPCLFRGRRSACSLHAKLP